MPKSKHQNHYDKNLNDWKYYGLTNDFKYMTIVLDLEEKDYYPLYFKNIQEFNIFSSNIISENKLKIIELINI